MSKGFCVRDFDEKQELKQIRKIPKKELVKMVYDYQFHMDNNMTVYADQDMEEATGFMGQDMLFFRIKNLKEIIRKYKSITLYIGDLHSIRLKL